MDDNWDEIGKRIRDKECFVCGKKEGTKYNFRHKHYECPYLECQRDKLR